MTWRLSDETTKRMCRDYENGMSTAALGRKYGPSKPTIIRILRKAGVTIRPPQQNSRQLTEDEIRRARAEYGYQGTSVLDLAAKHRCSKHVMRAALGDTRSGRLKPL